MKHIIEWEEKNRALKLGQLLQYPYIPSEAALWLPTFGKHPLSSHNNTWLSGHQQSTGFHHFFYPFCREQVTLFLVDQAIQGLSCYLPNFCFLLVSVSYKSLFCLAFCQIFSPKEVFLRYWRFLWLIHKHSVFLVR